MMKGLDVAIVLIAQLAVVVNGYGYWTSLTTDKVACTAEVLEHQDRYTCTSDGKVICNTGWKKDDPEDPLHPCRIPVCSTPCIHGKCAHPDVCSCEIGWKGDDCNTCIPLPGCDKGTCTSALECNCDSGYSGIMCDKIICNDCEQGRCYSPNVCTCNNGFTGVTCDTCVPMTGCQHGVCTNPNECNCNAGWEGRLCDRPKCTPECKNNAPCLELTGSNVCNCPVGFSGADCGTCVINPACPTAVTECLHNVPYTCDCGNLLDKSHPLCAGQ